MKLVDNAICLYCQKTDHITHFFLFCPKEKQFWNTFFTWWNNLGDIHIPTQCECLEKNVLFRFQNEGGYIHSSELLYTDSQYHIYCQRIHNENEFHFFNTIKCMCYVVD